MPTGHFSPLELNSKDHYGCAVRWLTMESRAGYTLGENGPGWVRMSVDRRGNFILGFTKQEWKGLGTFFGQKIGTSWKGDKTRWVRWTRRPDGADAALAAEQSLTITRQKHYSHYGPRQLITLGNFTGADVCARLWDQAGSNPDDPMAGIRNAGGIIGERKRAKDGSIYVDLPCSEGWEWLRVTQMQNYFVNVDEGILRDYRVAYRTLAKSDNKPVVIEVGDVFALPAPSQ